MRKLQKISIFLMAISYLVALFYCYAQPSQCFSSPCKEAVLSSKYNQALNKTIELEWQLSNVDVTKIDKNRKLIAFTFDDAPAKTLEQLIAVFLRYNAAHPAAPATATIFCNGCRVRRPVDTALHTAVAAGFELGNHTQNHKNLTTLSANEIREEIDKTDKLLSRYDGNCRHLFRAPYGELNAEVCSAIPAPAISWLIDTLDWTGVSAEAIYDTVWNRKSSGAIVLMHDGYENTVTALKRLLPDLYDAGYQAVSVSQMAKTHQCRLKIGSVYIRARKKTP